KRRRQRLPGVLDDMAWIGVSHELLPDPRPRTQGPRRGRGLAALDPPARRVRERVTSSQRYEHRRGLRQAWTEPAQRRDQRGFPTISLPHRRGDRMNDTAGELPMGAI